MNIVCSTDNNFVQHCCVMLTSVLLNNENVSVFLLTEGLSEANHNIIKQEVESKSGIFNYLLVDSDVISKLPMPKSKNLLHISSATYYRLLIVDLLPKSINKVIYLDCDIIVRKSLIELWNTNISNYAIGAVHQMWEEISEARRLGYPIDYGYFNAGVLLINLEYWRLNNISFKLIHYLTQNYQTIHFHDQDALNAILYNKSYILPCKWNMLSVFLNKEVFKLSGIYDGRLLSHYADYKRMLIDDIKEPTVIHFVSKPKPWQKYCLHPFKTDYFLYAKATIHFRGISKPNEIITYIFIGYVYTINLLLPTYHILRFFFNRYIWRTKI